MEKLAINDNLQGNEDEMMNFFSPFQTFSKTINVVSNESSFLNSIQPWHKESNPTIQHPYKSLYSARANVTAKQSFRKKMVISRKNSMNQQISYKNTSDLNQKIEVKADNIRISFKRNVSGKNNKYREQLANLMNTLEIDENDFKRIGMQNPQRQKINQFATTIVSFQDKIGSSLYCYPQSPSRGKDHLKLNMSQYYSQSSKGSNNLQKILKIKQKIRKKNHSKMRQTKRFSKSQTLTLVQPQLQKNIFCQSTELSQKGIFAKSIRNNKKTAIKIGEACINQMRQTDRKHELNLTQRNQKLNQLNFQLKKDVQKNQITTLHSKKLKTLQFWKARASKYLK